jgi:hypothetical protein
MLPLPAPLPPPQAATPSAAASAVLASSLRGLDVFMGSAVGGCGVITCLRYSNFKIANRLIHPTYFSRQFIQTIQSKLWDNIPQL